MSREDEYRITLEEERRREIEWEHYRNLANAEMSKAEAVKSELEKNFSLYYSEEEKSEMQKYEAAVKNNLQNNPSVSLNNAKQLVYRLGVIKSKAMELEKIRIQNENKKLQNEQLNEFSETLADSVVKNYANASLETLAKEIQSGKFADDKNEEKIKSRLEEIRTEAQKKADEWYAEQRRLSELKEASLKLEEYKAELLKELIEEAQKDALVQQTDSLIRELASTELQASDFSERIAAIEKQIQDYALKEAERREIVKSIFKQLKKQEFNVKNPQIQEDGSVLIVASKPSGKQAKCSVSLDGKMNYRFDNYEGKSCLKDLEKFNADLASCYSIKLSDERVIWENPDRISHEMNATSDDLYRSL